MKFSCVKMAEEVASGKSKTASKAKNTFSDEETGNMISLWSEEEVLFNSCHRDYFKNDARQSAVNRILLRLNKQGKPMKTESKYTSSRHNLGPIRTSNFI